MKQSGALSARLPSRSPICNRHSSIGVFYTIAIGCNRIMWRASKASRRSTSGTAGLLRSVGWTMESVSRPCPPYLNRWRHCLAFAGQAMSLVEPERSLDTDGSRQPREEGGQVSGCTSRPA